MNSAPRMRSGSFARRHQRLAAHEWRMSALWAEIAY